MLAPPLDDLVETADHSLRRQREVDLNAERLTAEVVDDVEQPERSAISQLVMHEVHRPYCVDRLEHRQRLWFHSVHTLLRLEPSIQLQLPENPAHALMVPEKTLNVTQIQRAKTKAPVPLVLRQPQQPLGDLGILRIELRLITISTFAHTKRLAGQTDAQAFPRDRPLGHLAPARWPQSFFRVPPR